MTDLLRGIVGMSDWRVWAMFGVGLALIWLAVKKEYEPNLLLPMGFGCLLANIPFSSAVGGGFLDILFEGGITVSYTHLRAHETRHDLVCRLLLEQKKK